MVDGRKAQLHYFPEFLATWWYRLPRECPRQDPQWKHLPEAEAAEERQILSSPMRMRRYNIFSSAAEARASQLKSWPHGCRCWRWTRAASSTASWLSRTPGFALAMGSHHQHHGISLDIRQQKGGKRRRTQSNLELVNSHCQSWSPLSSTVT